MDTRAVVHDLLPLFAEQQSIPLPWVVLMCPTCLHTHKWRHTNICKAHISPLIRLSLAPSLSLIHSEMYTDKPMHMYTHAHTVSLLSCPSSAHSPAADTLEKHTHKNTRTPPRLIVAVMGRVSSNGTHKCPGEKAVCR